MTNGTFRTWETIALGTGFIFLLACLFIADASGGEPNLKSFFIAAALVELGLFAKPIWLLGNWKEIKKWERTTAFVRKNYTTGRGKAIRYHLYLEFFSGNGKIHHKDIVVRTTFKAGDQNEIMFAEEYMDALIFVPQAFRQAVISAVLGIVLEAVNIICMILL